MKYYTAAVCLGWPSFSDLMKEDSITESDDFSIGMHRLEVACSQVNYNSRFYSFIDLHAHLSVHLSLSSLHLSFYSCIPQVIQLGLSSACYFLSILHCYFIIQTNVQKLVQHPISDVSKSSFFFLAR